MNKGFIISILVFLLLITLGLATFLNFNHSINGVSSKSKPFCGVKGESRSVYDIKADTSYSSTVSVQIGKKIFKANCSSCHASDMRTKLTGPPLINTKKRWAKYPKEDLYNFVRNSQKMIEDEHPMSVAVWEEYGQSAMTGFPNLSDDDIESVFLYVNTVYY